MVESPICAVPSVSPAVAGPDEAVPVLSDTTVSVEQPQAMKLAPGEPDAVKVTSTPARGAPRASVTRATNGAVRAPGRTAWPSPEVPEATMAVGTFTCPLTTWGKGVDTVESCQS